MLNSKIFKTLLAALGLCLTLALSACTKNESQPKSDHLNIVTTTDFYGEVAQAVLGSHGTVTPIITNPSIDPHDYEPTTKTAKLVAKADLAVYNGLEYDSWIKKLGAKKYLTVASVTGAKIGQNEHLWYQPQTMSKLALALAKKYGQLDPKHKQEYLANAKKYQAKLAPLTKMVAQIKANSRGQKVAVSEPVFDYSLEAMGYHIINKHFAMAAEEETDPSYTDIKKLQTAIKNKEIAFFVLNTQSDSKVITNMVKLCQEYKIPVVKVTETLPAHQNYVSWMKKQYQQVLTLQK
ncbi:metal ABC transporter solute-binding protein, Zn/Mn family [Ligilactobacillus agilis]|uniref:metal ABC transporter solute-binding protein, Zn/Mn family n=1 Tax=Ligilactobacillus agilis TaxID=1601 RepID=UPI00255CCC79|nr:zinc ABC transporter substrate-binding protein [Ligilactobacillus agilis]